MPHYRRQESASGYYHVLARGQNRKEIFLDETDYRCYLQFFVRFKEEFPCKCYHFCLMPNHVHLLLHTENLAILSALMRRAQQAYQFHWRRRYDLVGHLWQGRFKSIPIEEESYLLECGRYIERNPIRAELCTSPEDYPWSSAHDYLLDQPKRWGFIDPNPSYLGIGSSEQLRQKHYREYVTNARPYETLLDQQLQALT